MKKIIIILILGFVSQSCVEQDKNNITGEWYSDCDGTYAKLVIVQDGDICRLETTFDKNGNGIIDEEHGRYNGRSYTGQLEGDKITISQTVGSKELLYSKESKTIYFIDCEWKRNE